MANEDIVCDACGLPPHGKAAATIDDGLPDGWFIRVFGRRRFRLCDCCGDILHFKGGVSAYLQDALGLSEHAVCDFAAGRGPSTGLYRQHKKAEHL
jgi:hypothetical protein